jgi:hypothetical protein
MHRRVHDPVLAPGELQDEHVVHVVMGREPARGRWRHVSVGLDRVPELLRQRHGEVDHRGPRAVQRLQHHGGALGEERGHLVVMDLVADLCAHPARAGERAGVDHRPVARQAQERRAEATPGEQLVHPVEVQ